MQSDLLCVSMRRKDDAVPVVRNNDGGMLDAEDGTPPHRDRVNNRKDVEEERREDGKAARVWEEEGLSDASVYVRAVVAGAGPTCSCHCTEDTGGRSTFSFSSESKSQLKLLVPPTSAAMNLLSIPAARGVFHAASTAGAGGGGGAGAGHSSKVWYYVQHLVYVYTPHACVILGLIICALTCLGAYTLYTMCTRKRCACGLCVGRYRDTDYFLGSGGFGSVHLIETTVSTTGSGGGFGFLGSAVRGRAGNNTEKTSKVEQLVAKMVAVEDITALDEHQREAKQLLTLSSHKNIVSYVDDFVHVEFGLSGGGISALWGADKKNGRSTSSFFRDRLNPRNFCVIIQEYCQGGDLRDQINYHYNSFTEEKVNTWFQELVSAVEHLHSKNIIHRDVKSQNVFLASDGSVRLGDFGLSCRQTGNDETRSYAGTDCYVAPEFLMTMHVGASLDVWALGCLLLELITGKFMWDFPGSFAVMVLQEPTTTEKFLKKHSASLKAPKLTKIVKKLLIPTVSERPQAHEISNMITKNMVSKKGFQNIRFGAFAPTNAGKKKVQTKA